MSIRFFTGIASRGIAAIHLKSIAFVMFVLLTVAIAIDLTKTIDDLRAKAVLDERSLLFLTAEYLLYRSADIVARMLPMACLAGSFIAELLRHQRLENVILAAAGAPPSLTFAALLSVAAITGTVQVALEGWLRPAAVFAQVDLGLGAYARRFYQGDLGERWIVDGDRAIKARIIRDEHPELRDVRIFEGLGEKDLRRVISAPSAEPTGKSQFWRLTNAIVWHHNDGKAMRPEMHGTLDVKLPLTQSHLQYHGIYGFYLPNKPLLDIAAVKNTQRTSDAETALVRRFTALFLPGVFAFLGASLSQAGRNGRMLAWWRLLALGAFGYICVVSIKAFWSLGEFGVLSPFTATFLPMGFALLVGMAIQVLLNSCCRGRRR